MAKSPVALFIFTNDTDDYLSSIETEKKQIRQALEPYHDTNRLLVIMETFTSKSELIRLFERYAGRIVLFHYSGHATDNSIILNSEVTNTEIAYSKGIAGFIAKEVKKRLKLVFLNGCSTVPQVATLKEAGVENIIATNFPISDNKAAQFATQFYRTMANASKDNPFEGKPTSIQEAYEAAKNYLETSYEMPKIKENMRGFVVEPTLNTSIPWELYTTTPNWYLPNIRHRNWLMLALIVILPLIAFYAAYAYFVSNTPIDLTVTLDNKTPNTELPPLDARLSITYKGETKIVENIQAEATFKNLIKSRNEKVFLSFEAEGFENRDTTIALTKGMILPIWRDDFYATVKGKVINDAGTPLEGVQVNIQDIKTFTDAAGYYELKLPAEKQRPKQRVEAYKKGYKPRNFETTVQANESVDFVLYE